MRLLRLLIAGLALAAACPAAAQTPADPIGADWRAIPDDEILILTLEGGRRVMIRLTPRYAPVHVDESASLATAKWWDGTSIYREQRTTSPSGAAAMAGGAVNGFRR